MAGLVPTGLRQAPPPPLPPAEPQFIPDEPPEDNSYRDPVTGELITPQDDGSVIIGEPPKDNKSVFKGFYENLADKIDDYKLATIAEDILQGINADLESRRDWEASIEKGIDLLGLKIESATSEVGGSGTISKVYHPLLLEAVIRYQANARSELLPANGPVKVRDDEPVVPQPKPIAPPQPVPPTGGLMPPQPMPPPAPPFAPPPPQTMAAGIVPNMGHNGGPPLDDEPSLDRDIIANAFELDYNHYLTTVAKEYYPDFDRMLFSLGLIGVAFRKMYHCALRRRPVDEWVPAQDLIISNEATELYNAGRFTHRTKMRNAVVRRMQAAGVYRDVELGYANETVEGVDSKIKQVVGIDPQPRLPADHRHTIYEAYVDLDLPGYEEDFPVPYRITIDKDSRMVLEIRRNWKEDDEDFKALRRFVKYGIIPGLGFYDYGFIHILGNTSRALTAIERQLLDAGQFANFPGMLFSKMGMKQPSNQIRVSPGSGHEIDTGGLPIQQVVMPLPYKEPSAVLAGLAQTVAQDGMRLGGSAELPVGEGTADIPVGTMIAMIEQATKPMSAVHKRNHATQQEEYEILRELFAEDPTALWKFAKTPARKWQQAEEFMDLELVPAADPNTPSHIHRIMQATALMQLSGQAPQLYDMRAVHEKALNVLGIGDTDSLMAPPPNPNAPPPPPPPQVQEKLVEAQARQQEQQREMQQTALEGQQRIQQQALKNQNDQANRESHEQIAALKLVGDHQKTQQAAHSTAQAHLGLQNTATGIIPDLLTPPLSAGSVGTLASGA